MAVVRPASVADANGAQKRNARITTKVFDAPVGGLVTSEKLFPGNAATAWHLENFWPTTRGVKVRGGCVRYATVADHSAVESLILYDGQNRSLIAATSGGIYDVSSPSAPDTDIPPALSGRNGGVYSSANFATAGGSFLYMMNGADKPVLFDGASFSEIDDTTTPNLTGVSDVSKLHAVWAYANRLFFAEKDSLNVHYLSPDQIGGTLGQLSLGGVFQMGGEVIAGAPWSMDTGAGIDDRCVIVSSRGEVAIYSGIDPGDPNAWSLQGVYRIPEPLGRRCLIRRGGDVLIATKEGIVSVADAVRLPFGQLLASAITKPIENLWRRSVRHVSNDAFDMTSHGRFYMTNALGVEDVSCLALNGTTNAWAAMTGWGARCVAEHAGKGLFGGDDGRVYLFDESGSDDGVVYVCRMATTYTMIDGAASATLKQARPVVVASKNFRFGVSANVDYRNSFPTPPPPPPDMGDDLWDVGKWDEAIWNADSIGVVHQDWRSVGITGSQFSIQAQMSFANTFKPDVEIQHITAQLEVGAVVE